jgi:hypothetical protein
VFIMDILILFNDCFLPVSAWFSADDSNNSVTIAVKYEYDKDTISRLIEICPDLLSLARETSKYKGQTPLHIAITKGDNDVTEF